MKNKKHVLQAFDQVQVKAEITVKLHCLCGCGRTMDAALQPQTLAMGDVGVWELGLFEVALGLIPPGHSPHFHEVLCNTKKQ